MTKSRPNAGVLKGARQAGLGDRARDIAAADFRAAAVFDDRFSSRPPHQPAHVAGIGTFAGGAEDLDGAPVQIFHATGVAPDFDQTWNHSQHGRLRRSAQKRRTRARWVRQ